MASNPLLAGIGTTSNPQQNPLLQKNSSNNPLLSAPSGEPGGNPLLEGTTPKVPGAVQARMAGRVPVPGATGQTTGPQAPIPSNPFEFAAGLARNIGAGVASAVHGIGELGGAVGHDFLNAGADLISLATPWNPAIAKDKSTGIEMAKNLVGWGSRPSAVLQDYKARYGPLLRGDWSEFGRQLYEQPVSFALDATMVGSAVAAPFKFAELGATTRLAYGGMDVAEATAKVIGERGALATRVLGTGERAKILSLTSPGLEKGLPLSSNPVTRSAEHFIYRAISEPVQKAVARVAPEGATTVEALIGKIQAQKAAETGISRAYYPSISRLAEERLVGMLHGIRRANLGTLKREGMAALYRIWEPLNAEDRALGMEFFHGSVRMPIPDGHTPLVDFKTKYDIPFGPETRATPVTADVRLRTYKTLLDSFGMEKGIARVHDASFETPHDYAVEGTMRYAAELPEITPATVEAATERAAQALNGRIRGVYNYMDKDASWKGVHAFIDTADGTVEISFATPKLYRSQSAASGIGALRDKNIEDSLRFANEADEAVTDAARVAADAKAEFHRREGEAFDAMARSMFEGPLRQQRGGDYPAALQAVDEQRVWDWKYLAEPEIRYGLTGQVIMNHIYGPQRLTSFHLDMANLEAMLPDILAGTTDMSQSVPAILNIFSKFPEDLVQAALRDAAGPVEGAPARLVDALSSRMRESVIDGTWPGYTWQEMHGARVAEGLATPIYFPHFRISDNPFSEMAGAGRVGWKGTPPSSVTKHWMGYVYEEGTLIKDPIEAYSRVFGSIARHQHMVRFIDQVIQTFGRKVTPEELKIAKGNEIGPEVYINPTGAKAEVNIRALLEAETHEGLRRGLTYEQATARSIEALLPRLQTASMEASTGELYAVPRHIAKAVSAGLKSQLGWKSRVFWDSPIAVWRAAVLSFSPRWVVNNTIGNVIFTGIKDPRALRYAVRQFSSKQRALMEYMIGPENLAEIEGGYIKSIGNYGQKGAVSDELLMNAPKWVGTVSGVQDIAPIRGLKAVSSYVRRMNSNIEEAFRRGVYMSALEKNTLTGFARGFGRANMTMERIAREGVTKAAHDAAIKATNDTLGNYTALSPFEQDVIRRFVAPFYPFYRHVFKFVAKMPFEHPFKTSALMAIDAIDKDFDATMPEWVRNAVGIGDIGPGPSLYVNFRNANPLQAAVDIGGGPLSIVNPALKIIIERATGTQTFGSQKEFYDPNIIETRNGMHWRIIRDSKGRFLGVQPVEGKTLPSFFQHVLSQFPEYQLAQTAEQAVLGPGSGAKASATGETLVDPKTGQPLFPTPWYTPWLNYAGIPIYQYDLADMQRKFFEAQQEAINSGLRG